jgi:hypothetical protein
MYVIDFEGLVRGEETRTLVFRPHPAVEQFPAKRIPLGVAKLRSYKELERVTDADGSATALIRHPIACSCESHRVPMRES